MSESRTQGGAALVTGGSRGLGRAVAAALGAEGWRVAVLARPSAELDAAVRELRTAGVEARAYPADLNDPAQVEAAAVRCASELGPVEVLVNNAGVQGAIGPVLGPGGADWERVFAVNLFAAVRLVRVLVPPMVGRGFGRVINVSGGGATGPRPDFAAYAASKCALVRFTETLAEELAGTGVTVNAVAPGAMNTRMRDEVLAAGPERARGEYEATRARSSGTPPEAAAALVAWLASGAADGITGRLISAVWDDWQNLPARANQLAGSDIYTLRRITPDDRGGWKKCA